MKRKLLAVMMAVCMTASFAGGTATVFAAQEESTAKDEVIVTMPTTSEQESGFDPAYGWGAGEHVHEPLIQSTLTITNTDLSIGKDLATDYSVSDDGLTWTVKIRDDVKFTDGEPLTASDVAFTYNNCRDNSSVNDFSMLKEAVAVDDTTVEFHMNTPFAVWPYTMAIVGIVPEHAYDENYGQNPIGSGRYIMKQWDKGQQVIFEANPDYYGEAPKMKKVTVLFMEEDAALAAAQSGTVDVAHTAASYSDITVDGYDLFSVQTVDNRGFNLPATAAEEIDGVTYGNDFTSDVEVRRAINLGIDREEMIENVLNGYGTPAYSVCDKMPWYNEEAEVEYDLDKAKEILADENDWVKGMKVVKMQLGEPDSSGRRRPEEIPGSEYEIELDTVIMSLGTSPNPLISSTTKGLEVNKRRCIIAEEETGKTSKDGVYAGGDAVTGAATVILAMGAGKAGAKGIDEYLKNK